eukprot:scaffold4478_cov65-Phaeocystis_antarctica.AAC.8
MSVASLTSDASQGGRWGWSRQSCSPGALIVRVIVRVADLVEGHLDGGLNERPKHVDEDVDNVAHHATDRVETEEPAEVPANFVVRQHRREVDVVQHGRRRSEQVDANGRHGHRDKEDADRTRSANHGVLALECPGDGVQATEGQDGPPELRRRLWRCDHGVRPDRGKERWSLLKHVSLDAMVPVLPRAGQS